MPIAMNWEPRARLIYRLLLLSWPRQARRDHGRELEDMFIHVIRASRARTGWLGGVLAVVRGLVDLLLCAPSAHALEWRARRLEDFRKGRVRKETRMGWLAFELGEARRDLVFAWRGLLRDRTFTLTALLTLATCVAGNAAIYGIVKSVLLDPLPLPEIERIVLLTNLYPKGGFSDAGPESATTAVPDYFDRQREIDVFEEQGLYRRVNPAIGTQDGAHRAAGLSGTPSFYRMVGARPQHGRGFTEDDGKEGNNAKVMLSYGYWQRQFGGDPTLIGRDIRLNGTPHRVVGVLPPDFRYLWPEIDVWLPRAFTAQQRSDMMRHTNNDAMIARLKPGVTVQQAQRAIDALNARNQERYPHNKQLEVSSGFYTRVVGLQDRVVRDVRPTLYLLWCGALIVLLIGGVNLANLYLVRSAGRARELATRFAIGAGIARLSRQLLTEAMLLTVTGGVIGIAIGWWLLRSLAMLRVELLPRGDEIGLDWPSAGIMIGLAAAVGLLMTITPIVHLSRSRLYDALRAGRSGAASGMARHLRSALATAQIAFAFVLLISAGLLFASFRAVLQVDPGFQPYSVLTAWINLPGSRYLENARLVDVTGRLLAQLRGLPGVNAAGATNSLPFGGNYSSSIILAEASAVKAGELILGPHQITASDGYFETLRIPLVSGRYFDSRDTPDSAPVVIIDQRLANTYWPGQNAVGRRLYKPSDPSNPLAVTAATRFLTVVGVVKNVQLTGLAPRDALVGAYYFPYTQMPTRAVSFAVRSEQDPGSLIQSVRSAVASVDRELPLFDVQTMDTRMQLSLVPRRVPVLLAGAFGLVALFLAAIGVYGVLAHQVSQRRREIGIRVALGSSPREVFGIVLRDGSRIAAAGIAIGLAGTLVMARVITGLLYQVRPTDPVVIAGVAALLVVVALVAILIPARRAARVSPLVVLSE